MTFCIRAISTGLGLAVATPAILVALSAPAVAGTITHNNPTMTKDARRVFAVQTVSSTDKSETVYLVCELYTVVKRPIWRGGDYRKVVASAGSTVRPVRGKGHIKAQLTAVAQRGRTYTASCKSGGKALDSNKRTRASITIR